MNAVPAASLLPLGPIVRVHSDDRRLRMAVSHLLHDAGFAIGDAVGQSDAELRLLLAGSGTRERLAAAGALHRQHPRAPIVVAMPSDAGAADLRRALRAGADGIVLDGELMHTLVPTIQAVAVGQLVMPRSLRRHVAPPALSHREKEILGLVVRGYTNRQIADALYVAESTVKTHLSSAFGKLDTRSRSEAAALILDPAGGGRLGTPTIARAAGPRRS